MLKLNRRLVWTSGVVLVILVNLISFQVESAAEAKAEADPGRVFFSDGKSSYGYQIPEAKSKGLSIEDSVSLGSTLKESIVAAADKDEDKSEPETLILDADSDESSDSAEKKKAEPEVKTKGSDSEISESKHRSRKTERLIFEEDEDGEGDNEAFTSDEKSGRTKSKRKERLPLCRDLKWPFVTAGKPTPCISDREQREIEEESGFGPEGPRLLPRPKSPAYGIPPPRPRFLVRPPIGPPGFEDRFIETRSEEDFERPEYNPFPPERPFYSKPTYGGYGPPRPNTFSSSYSSSYGQPTTTTTPRPAYGYGQATPAPTVYGQPSAPSQLQTGYQQPPQNAYGQPTQAPLNSYGQPQPTPAPPSSYGQSQPQNSYGQTQTQSSYGQSQPQNSYQQSQPQNSYGQPQSTQSSQTLYGNQQTNMYGQTQQNSYGQAQQNSYGQTQQNTYGQAQQNYSYGQPQKTQAPQNIYGQAQPTQAPRSYSGPLFPQNPNFTSQYVIRTGGRAIGSSYNQNQNSDLALTQKLTKELEMYKRLVQVLMARLNAKNSFATSPVRTSNFQNNFGSTSGQSFNGQQTSGFQKFGTPTGQSVYKQQTGPPQPMILPRPISPVTLAQQTQGNNQNQSLWTNFFTQGVTTTPAPQPFYPQRQQYNNFQPSQPFNYNDDPFSSNAQFQPVAPSQVQPFYTQGPYDRSNEDSYQTIPLASADPFETHETAATENGVPAIATATQSNITEQAVPLVQTGNGETTPAPTLYGPPSAPNFNASQTGQIQTGIVAVQNATEQKAAEVGQVVSTQQINLSQLNRTYVNSSHVHLSNITYAQPPVVETNLNNTLPIAGYGQLEPQIIEETNYGQVGPQSGAQPAQLYNQGQQETQVSGGEYYGQQQQTSGSIYAQPGSQQFEGSNYGQPQPQPPNGLNYGQSQPQPQPEQNYVQPQPQPGQNYGQQQPQPGQNYGQQQPQPGQNYGQPQPQPASGLNYGQAEGRALNYGPPQPAGGSNYGQSQPQLTTGTNYGQAPPQQAIDSNYGQQQPAVGVNYGQPQPPSGPNYGQPQQQNYGQPQPTTGQNYGQPQPAIGQNYGQPQQITGSSYGQTEQASGGQHQPESQHTGGWSSDKPEAVPASGSNYAPPEPQPTPQAPVESNYAQQQSLPATGTGYVPPQPTGVPAFGRQGKQFEFSSDPAGPPPPPALTQPGDLTGPSPPVAEDDPFRFQGEESPLGYYPGQQDVYKSVEEQSQEDEDEFGFSQEQQRPPAPLEDDEDPFKIPGVENANPAKNTPLSEGGSDWTNPEGQQQQQQGQQQGGNGWSSPQQGQQQQGNQQGGNGWSSPQQGHQGQPPQQGQPQQQYPPQQQGPPPQQGPPQQQGPPPQDIPLVVNNQPPFQPQPNYPILNVTPNPNQGNDQNNWTFQPQPPLAVGPTPAAFAPTQPPIVIATTSAPNVTYPAASIPIAGTNNSAPTTASGAPITALVIFPISGNDTSVVNSQVATLLNSQEGQKGISQPIVVPPGQNADFNDPSVIEDFLRTIDPNAVAVVDQNNSQGAEIPLGGTGEQSQASLPKAA